MIDQARELLSNPPSRERVDEAITLLGADASPDAKTLRARAYIYRAHNLGLGREWLDAAIAEVVDLHDHLAGQRALATAYAHKGWIRRQLEVELRILAAAPDDASAMAQAGWAAWFTGDVEGGRALFARSIAIAPAAGWTHFYAANAALAAGDAGAALASYGRAAELLPKASSPLAGIGWSHLAAGDRDAAAQATRALAGTAVDEERFWVKLADLEVQLGVPAAAAHAERAVREAPESRYRPRGFLASTVLAAATGDTRSLEQSERLDRARLDQGDETYEPLLDLAAVASLRGAIRERDERLAAARTAGWRGPQVPDDALLVV